MAQFIHKFKLVAFVCLSMVIGLSAAAQEKIPLQKAVDYTLQRNLTIKQALITEKLADADYKQAKYNQLPSVGANPQAGYNFGRSVNQTTYTYSDQTSFFVGATVQASVTLYQGGQLRNQIIQNRLLLDVDKSSTAKVKNDLILNVVTDYLQILTNQALVEAAKQQIDIANQTFNKAKISFDVGNMTRADLAQAEAQVSTATYNLTTAQNQLDLTILILKQYMEMDPNTPIEVERPDVSKLSDVKLVYDATDVIKTAIGVNPDIHLAQAQQETFAQALKIARGTLYPTVSLFANAGSNYSNLVTQHIIGQFPGIQPIGYVGNNTGQVVNTATYFPIIVPYSGLNQFRDNFNQSIGVNVSIPIFNRNQGHTNVTKAKLNLENAELSTQIAKNNLSKTIIQAVLDLHAADKQYQSAVQTFNSNKEALNVTKQRYDVGLVNTLDYNTALTNYNKAQNDMIQAQYTMIFRSKIIDYYLGNTITL